MNGNIYYFLSKKQRDFFKQKGMSELEVIEMLNTYCKEREKILAKNKAKGSIKSVNL
jgi:hypothetical protein